MKKEYLIIENLKMPEKKTGIEKAPVFGGTGCPECGFTLLELLVAMLMVTMVTTIIAVALKLSLNSWERAQDQGDAFQAKAVIPSVLGKQLDAAVKQKVFAQGHAPKKLKFTGQENRFSFFTSYTPMAANMTGLLRVSYVYDPDKKMLYLYQQLILTPEDLKDIHNPVSEKWDGRLEPSGKIAGILKFNIRYSKKKSYGQQDMDIVSTVWENRKNQYPASVFLEFENAEGPAENSEPQVWHFVI